ncbi:MAG: diguanylate cyclase [Campylobacterota bacterium]|nr:diguanylate cyclase [Campylobacterota bacterium]
MITDIIKNVFIQLNKEQIPVTPDMYRKFFCQEAKKLGMYMEECNSITLIKETLSYKNRTKLKELNIDNMDMLLEYLTQRLEGVDAQTDVSDLIGIINVLKTTMEPSIGSFYSQNINDFEQKISQNPALLIDDALHNEIYELINERKRIDKEAIIAKTSELTSILANVTDSVNRSITTNKDGNFNISNIKKELEQLELNEDDDSLGELKEQFISIADAIESETSSLSDILSKENSKVNLLNKRIQMLESQLSDAKEQSNTDFLTGAMTRKAFDEKLKELEKKYIQNSEDFSVIFFDLDHFKSVNDTYGHDAGDKVLSTFSKLLRKEFKDFGDIARYGGEEFVALCPNKDKHQANNHAQKVKNIVGGSRFVYEEHKLHITFSGGVCQRSDKSSLEILIKDADKLLYKAKENGRDRIQIS